MKRHEVMAIVGAYSRQGFNAAPASGGFWIDSENAHEYRTMREARIDTGVNFSRVTIRGTVHYRAQLHAGA